MCDRALPTSLDFPHTLVVETVGSSCSSSTDFEQPIIKRQADQASSSDNGPDWSKILQDLRLYGF
ncbi:MAG: hypothetical protein UW63_C0043G0002 [Candidatus Uhrbacteria bacterium GW2011_GWF2_44_350]|uniref:Uncharacterized protein n=1 Tax=Candidatus Uhrbacteria bacterium GW2011_GWF2_44_350 TaxID=1619000 RepID=A0A0G1LM93_9BACT|nr:MAG: hypothetical protein UW63_C0043G0002 [Candidatus Uhrbacteria bacterium GW2011_GWF2_44_350]HBR80084.1 hypothetical protein [Candidatus Uhrbacteria bacterium]HCU32216.1 hypothetical protein [Candidatus Uhrbacteria bacterium]